MPQLNINFSRHAGLSAISPSRRDCGKACREIISDGFKDKADYGAGPADVPLDWIPHIEKPQN